LSFVEADASQSIARRIVGDPLQWAGCNAGAFVTGTRQMSTFSTTLEKAI